MTSRPSFPEPLPINRGIPAADLARLVHDLRNGIGGIAGLAEILRETRLPPVQDELVSCLVRGVGNQLDLLDNLLQWTSAKSQEPKMNNFLLVEALETCARLHQGSAFQKGLRLVLNIEPGLSESVSGLGTPFQQAVCNLVSNAVRYTETGTIRLSAWRENKTAVIVDVEDSGPGVPLELQSSLFQPFVHGAHSDSHGLGLAIVREHASAMGGTVECLASHSGAHFRLRLPLVETTAAPIGLNLNGRRVLILTSEQLMSESLSRAFSYHGFSASSAPCASGAIAILRSHQRKGSKFDLIVVDAEQGGLDSSDVIAMLRSELKQSTPIVSLQSIGTSLPIASGKTTQQMMSEYRLALPIVRQDVADLVSHLIPGETDGVVHDKHASTPNRNPTLETSAARSILVVEDDAIQRTVMRRMLESDGHSVEAVGSLDDARTRLNMVSVDLILCDYILPDGDGLTLAREFQQCLYEATPFFLSTGQPTAVLQARAKMAGVIGILSKPNTKKTLREALAVLVNQPPRVA